MKANRSYDKRKILLPKKSLQSLAVLATLLICLITNSALAQVTTAPKSEGEPVDPVREKQKEAYFKELKEGNIAPVEKQKNPVEMANPVESTEPVDPARELQKEAYFKALKEGKSTPVIKQEAKEDFSAEALPDWKDTGDFEADKAAYLLAVEGWLQRNASLYSEEELEFLKKPILRLEEKQQNLINN